MQSMMSACDGVESADPNEVRNRESSHSQNGRLPNDPMDERVQINDENESVVPLHQLDPTQQNEQDTGPDFRIPNEPNQVEDNLNVDHNIQNSHPHDWPRQNLWLFSNVQFRRMTMKCYNDRTRSHVAQKRVVLTIHNRKSKLLGFLMLIYPLVLMDDWFLLPIGLVLYSVALQWAYENWMEELELARQSTTHVQFEVEKWIQTQRQHHHSLQQAIDRAKFEIHLMQNRPHVNIVSRPVGNNSGRYEVFAI